MHTLRKKKKNTWFITVQSLEILVTSTVVTIYTINAPSIDTRCPQRVCTNDAFISSYWCVRVCEKERWTDDDPSHNYIYIHACIPEPTIQYLYLELRYWFGHFGLKLEHLEGSD